jgi:hypothetical protein
LPKREGILPDSEPRRIFHARRLQFETAALLLRCNDAARHCLRFQAVNGRFA